MTDKVYIHDTQGLIDFIAKSPSCYHVINNICTELSACGYTELFESIPWSIQPGKKYFTCRNGSSLIAFSVPENNFDSFMICASHSDSPTFKLKPNFKMEADGAYVKLNVEKYGGMIMQSWLDRPLSIAGRLIVESENGIEVKTVNIDRDLCVIPSLAIHMQRDSKDKPLNAQSDMLPLIGGDISSEKNLLAEAAYCANIDPDKILGHDLFLYNRQKGSIWGIDNEFYSSPKIDDLQCVYASLKAMEHSEINKAVNVFAVFDNEEVGSGTKQGACSTLLYDTLKRINSAVGRSDEQYLCALSSSLMLSADNGHAVHPNQPDKACPTNRPHMNGGVVIKYNANQRYTTDGISEAMLKRILKTNNIPYQAYANRSDIPGGSTLGNLSNTHVSLNTVDIGMAQLAMHSSYETGGTRDTTYLINAITAFYRSHIKCIGNDKYEL